MRMCENCGMENALQSDVNCWHCKQPMANDSRSSACSPQEGSAAFARLSEEAQDLIVRAFLGEFDDSPPPEMPDSVKAEIADWASKDEEENA